MKKFTLIIIILTLFLGKNFAQESKSNLLKEWDKIDLYKDQVQKKFPDFGLYAALIWNGKIISEKTMGYANREMQQPFTQKTIFLWGSVSKMFTSIAIMQLVERGKLKLETPITRYIPELGSGVDSLGKMKSIKIYHLINHSSGINLKPAYDSLKAKHTKFRGGLIPTTQEIKPYLKFSKQFFKPGTRFRYSNSGYSLLGVLIERVTQKKFTDYVSQNIFKPLGMSTAHFYPTPKKWLKDHAKVYLNWKGKMINALWNKPQGFQEGNGGVKASISDMMKFMDFLKFRKRKKFLTKYKKVLSDQMLAKAYLKVDLQKPNAKRYTSVYQGKTANVYRIGGFEVWTNKKGDSALFGHSGYISYHTSSFLMNKNEPFGVIVICNTDSFRRKDARYKVKRKLFDYLNYFTVFQKFKDDLYNWKEEKKN